MPDNYIFLFLVLGLCARELMEERRRLTVVESLTRRQKISLASLNRKIERVYHQALCGNYLNTASCGEMNARFGLNNPLKHSWQPRKHDAAKAKRLVARALGCG